MVELILGSDAEGKRHDRLGDPEVATTMARDTGRNRVLEINKDSLKT